RFAKSLKDLREAARIRLRLHGADRPRTSSLGRWQDFGTVVVVFGVLGAMLLGGAHAAERARRWWERRFYRKTLAGPGASVATPIAAKGLPDVQRAAHSRRCPCGRSHRSTLLEPGDSVRTGAGTVVHTVRLACACGEVAVVYFVE